jgi:hypothetical protein
MGRLDSYDTEELVKWHHFAFRADLARVRELRVALEAWTMWREREPLEAFVAKYLDEYERRLVNDVVAGPVDPSIFAPLLANAAAFNVDVDVVSARIAALSARITRADQRSALSGAIGRPGSWPPSTTSRAEAACSCSGARRTRRFDRRLAGVCRRRPTVARWRFSALSGSCRAGSRWRRPSAPVLLRAGAPAWISRRRR